VNGSLDAPVAKLRRAIHHYRTLKTLQGGGDHKARAVTPKAHIDGLTYEFYIGQIESLDPDIPLILGDAFHNIRSALDCLAFQLHLRRHRGRLPPNVANQSAFPIFTREPRYPMNHRNRKLRGTLIPSSDWRAIKTLAKRERAAIEWLQPYKGFDTRWPRPKSHIGQYRSGLTDINRFDIIDKHHQPHLVAAALIGVMNPRFPGADDFGFRQKPQFGRSEPLVSDAHVDTWTFNRPPPPEYVNMHPGVLTGISMEPDAGDRIDVLPNLGGSIWIGAKVVERFANRFPYCDFGPLNSDLTEVHRTIAQGPHGAIP